jgi:hypothetical protein
LFLGDDTINWDRIVARHGDRICIRYEITRLNPNNMRKSGTKPVER